jgi:hypothetical protein
MFGEWGNDEIEPLLAADVVVATALTDTVYVLFTNAVVRRDRLPAATWSSVWYLLACASCGRMLIGCILARSRLTISPSNACA